MQITQKLQEQKVEIIFEGRSFSKTLLYLSCHSKIQKKTKAPTFKLVKIAIPTMQANVNHIKDNLFQKDSGVEKTKIILTCFQWKKSQFKNKLKRNTTFVDTCGIPKSGTHQSHSSKKKGDILHTGCGDK